MNCQVHVQTNGTNRVLNVKEGTRLLDAIRGAGIDISAPCGGKGTCGKCLVRIVGTPPAPPTGTELRKIGEKALAQGYRLACMTFVLGDMKIHIPDQDEKNVVKTDGYERDIVLQPLVRKQYVMLSPPTLEDQAPDAERLFAATGTSRCRLSLMTTLPVLLRNADYRVTVTSCDDEIVHVESGQTDDDMYGMAVDIGTTTIAAYLFHLTTGRKVRVFSRMNPQRPYGADVISRIQYTMEHPEGLGELKQVIVGCLNEIMAHFCEKACISCQHLYMVTVVGNTTMMHLLLGLDPHYIAVSPFIPVTTSMLRLRCADIGINAAPGAMLVALPCVSAYIGADTVAAILSTGLYAEEQPCLLLDLGTNGEIALGGRKGIYCCSTAAGPAFEGANIRHGMAGIGGAIETVSLLNSDENPSFSYTSIGNQKPEGICGSGIVDVVAGMLKAGILDGTGRIRDPEEMPADIAAYYGKRIVSADGMKAFLIVPQAEAGIQSDIVITQKDVRELQNAKAAIAAGIQVLLREAGLSERDIPHIYLAGGFGNFVDVESAFIIGLLPPGMKGRVLSVGNAAGSGAREGLLSADMLRQAEEISRRIRYIELSARADFMEFYMDCMMYGDE